MHPYQHPRSEQTQKSTQVYRVICNGELKPGDMIESIVVARDCDLALKYVKADSRYAASRVLDVTAGSGAEGQVLMARYTPVQ